MSWFSYLSMSFKGCDLVKRDDGDTLTETSTLQQLRSNDFVIDNNLLRAEAEEIDFSHLRIFLTSKTSDEIVLTL